MSIYGQGGGGRTLVNVGGGSVYECPRGACHISMGRYRPSPFRIMANIDLLFLFHAHTIPSNPLSTPGWFYLYGGILRNRQFFLGQPYRPIIKAYRPSCREGVASPAGKPGKSPRRPLIIISVGPYNFCRSYFARMPNTNRISNILSIIYAPSWSAIA